MKLFFKILIIVGVLIGLLAIAMRFGILPFYTKQEVASSHADVSSILDVHNKTELDEVVAGSTTKPVVIKVSASWCPPCQQLKPVYHSVAEHMHDKITFAQIDIDEFADRDAIESVKSLPTILFFKGGKEVHRTTGFISADQLKKELKKIE